MSTIKEVGVSPTNVEKSRSNNASLTQNFITNQYKKAIRQHMMKGAALMGRGKSVDLGSEMAKPIMQPEFSISNFDPPPKQPCTHLERVQSNLNQITTLQQAQSIHIDNIVYQKKSQPIERWPDLKKKMPIKVPAHHQSGVHLPELNGMITGSSPNEMQHVMSQDAVPAYNLNIQSKVSLNGPKTLNSGDQRALHPDASLISSTFGIKKSVYNR